jgi:hypothetical protein
MVCPDVASFEYRWNHDHEKIPQFYGSWILHGWSSGYVTDVLLLDARVSLLHATKKGSADVGNRLQMAHVAPLLDSIWNARLWLRNTKQMLVINDSKTQQVSWISQRPKKQPAASLYGNHHGLFLFVSKSIVGNICSNFGSSSF